MGILDLLRLGRGRPDYLASPFVTEDQNQLVRITHSEIFGTAQGPVTRVEAMRVPAVSKARQLICPTIGRFPIRVLNSSGEPLPDPQQPTWAYRTEGIITPWLRTTMTADDLLFFGHSLWALRRGTKQDGARYAPILAAERVPIERWKIDQGAILVDDQPVDEDAVCYFPGPVEGLLERAATTIREARDIAAATATRAKSPVPLIELHETGSDENSTPLTPDEVKDIVGDFIRSRRDPEGAVTYTPAGIELRAHGDKADSGFAIEGRNAIRLDIANHTGVPASLLDGNNGSSLTYETAQTRNAEFLDYGLSQFIEAIQQRLSADDIVPHGQSVRFDQSDFIALQPSPTGPTVQD